MIINGTLFNDFPIELQRNAINLDKCGVNETIWGKKYAIEFMNYLYKKNYAILGGDVYNHNLSCTFDNWYLDKINSQTWEDYKKYSHIKAKKFITDFYLKNGDNYYYLISFSNETNYIILDNNI